MNHELDTSVVLRLLVRKPLDQHEVALAFLNEAKSAGDAVFVSDLVVSETYFALQHHFDASKASVIESLRRLLAGGEIHASGHAEEVLAVENLATAKPGFVDRLIHAASANSGCQWVTFEKSASKLRDTLILKST